MFIIKNPVIILSNSKAPGFEKYVWSLPSTYRNWHQESLVHLAHFESQELFFLNKWINVVYWTAKLQRIHM